MTKKYERKANDLFGTLNAICNKTPIEYDKKLASAFMLALWLSHEKDLAYYLDTINPIMYSLPDELVFKYFMKKIPKKKRYIKWIKKGRVSKKKEKEILELCNKYNISKKESMLLQRN